MGELLLLLSQLFMVPMLVLDDMSPTLLELFMLPSVKQRLILMLITMHMGTEAMVLDTDSILMDMAIILDTQPLDIVMVLDTDMVLDTTDKLESLKNNSLTLRRTEYFFFYTYFHSVNNPLLRSGATILTF